MRNIVCCLVGASMLIYACGNDAKYEALDVVEEVVCDEEYASLDMEEPASLEDLSASKQSAAEYRGAGEIKSSSLSFGLFAADDGSGSGAGRGTKPQPSKENSPATPVAKEAEEPILAKKKIIKDGNMTIQTDDIAASKEKIDQLVKRLNGYYQREDLENLKYRISYDLIIRVPASNFDKLVATVEQGKDEVKSKNIRARDVSEEYVDLTIRLASKRDYLKQYTVLLSRATTIKDIVEVKEIIRDLHEEIERAEGRLRFLNDQVAFSTLNVKLYKEIERVYEPTPKDRFVERVKSGLNAGWDFVVGFVVFLTFIWPALLVLIPAGYFVRREIKKQKAKKE